MMHLVTNNLIIWIHGLVKESVEEIVRHEKDIAGENKQHTRKVFPITYFSSLYDSSKYTKFHIIMS